MKKETKELIVSGLASMLVLLFIYTSASKLFDIRDFQSSMGRQPLPTWLIKVLMKTLPATEIAVSLLLIFPKTRLIGFYVASGMMTAFTIYVGLGIAHALKNIPCSCGGIFKNISWQSHFYINLIFLAISIGGIILYSTTSHSRLSEATSEYI
jgi:putative oxidoreductase